MEALAVVGNVSLDRVGGRLPRVGGGPYWAARALRHVGARASVLARCADADRRFVLPRLAALGVPVRLIHGETTAAFSFSYADGVRAMSVDAIGDAWRADDVRELNRRARWIHVAPLLRSDFPAETLAALAQGRHVLLDGQGLVRRAQLGPLALDAEFDRSLLEHVSILKLSEEEADVIGDVGSLGVAEVVVTQGARGARVIERGGELHVPTRPLGRVDPTGAGDAFGVAYLAARAQGLRPMAAARRANAVAAAVIA